MKLVTLLWETRTHSESMNKAAGLHQLDQLYYR